MYKITTSRHTEWINKKNNSINEWKKKKTQSETDPSLHTGH